MSDGERSGACAPSERDDRVHDGAVEPRGDDARREIGFEQLREHDPFGDGDVMCLDLAGEGGGNVV